MAELENAFDSDSYGKGADDLERVALVRKRFRESKQALADWREEARIDYGFRAGHQWEAADLDRLRAQNRPAVTFNRVGAMVDAIHGLEVNNRQELRYLPREEGDLGVSDNITKAAKWARDECYAEDEESEAFEDAVICGIGCTETRMDYESEPDGKICIERRDPLQMYWDASARRRCLEDKQYVFHADWMAKAEVVAKWPDKADEAIYSTELDEPKTAHNADRAFLYEQDATDQERRKDEVLVLHYQCFKLEPFYRALDPFTGRETNLSAEDFADLKKRVKALGMTFKEARLADINAGDIPYVEQKRKVFYRGFYVGDTELEYGPLATQDGFTFRFVTGRRDRIKNQWYGTVRAMRDPQRWGNKWLSQVLDIVAANTKGGAFIEEGALADRRKAEEQWAAHAPLITLNEGGIQKIKERQSAPYPSGIDRLMQFAFDALPYVSGLNLETLGLADRAQAGVLEAQRRQSAVTILAPFFDSLRRYRKSQGKLLLAFIRQYFQPGRLMRVIGESGDPQSVQLMMVPDTAQYDVIVDQAPTSPDFRAKVWDSLKELLPVMLKQGYPIPPMIFEYTPLPKHVINQIKQYSEGFVPPAIQQQMQQMQKAAQDANQRAQKLHEENLQLKTDAQVEIFKVQGKRASDQERTQAKMFTAQLDATVERVNAMLENHTKQIVAQTQADSAERRASMDAFTKLRAELMKLLSKQSEPATTN